jgi:hypothetical protein
MEVLMNTPIKVDAARKDLMSTLADNRVSEKQIGAQVDAIFSNLEYSQTIPDQHRENAYGLMNATTEYYQHIRQYRTDQSRFKVNTEGLAHRVLDSLVTA